MKKQSLHHFAQRCLLTVHGLTCGFVDILNLDQTNPKHLSNVKNIMFEWGQIVTIKDTHVQLKYKDGRQSLKTLWGMYDSRGGVFRLISGKRVCVKQPLQVGFEALQVSS